MNDNDNFKINLKKEEFQIIYKNINEIFNGNSKTTDEYLKEILGSTKIEENGGFY